MTRASNKRPICHAIGTSCGCALTVVAQLVSAQDAAEPRGVIRIEVTGTNIPRTEGEAALPLQIITREDIERSGSASVAELMSKVSANVGGFNDQLSIGNQIQPFPRPGLSSVNLRGIGDGSTLVLINGRRVANYAFDGGAVDVSAIPLAAIDRVEILKDGASAIYGTDAIAGVVNFILRKDFQGVEVTGLGSWSEQGGGNQYQATASAGYGDITTDKFNVFVTLNYQKDEILRAADREFARTGFRPDQGLLIGNPASFPANIDVPDQVLGPNYATGCAPPTSFPITADGFKFCAFDPVSLADILPPVERTSVFGRATFQVRPDLQLFAEASYTYNQFGLSIQPSPAFRRFSTQGLPVLYPAGGPFYPTDFAAANGLSGDLSLWYRTVPLGNRLNDVDTHALRAVVGADGFFRGWDYNAAILYSRNRQSDNFASGYVSERKLLDAMATGLINPFGPSGPEGDALLASTQVYGAFHSATGSTLLIDAKASRDIYRLPAGPLAIALGGEGRRENLDNTFAPLANTGDVLAAGGEHHSVSGSRNVWAFYAEASVPLATNLETQLAARYDHYSDFGSTVNPKVALRWQPSRALLLRSSWGTGFRAPTMYDLYTPRQRVFTEPGPDFPDPIRCPVTDLPSDCFGGFPAVIGGNPDLQPETSEQFNAGVVWQPAPELSLALDYWKINKSGPITGISERDVLVVGAPFEATNIIRGPVDPEFPGLPGPIQTVILHSENFGNVRTSGYDVDIAWRGRVTSIGQFSLGFNGTYVRTFRLQFGPGDSLSLAGNNDGNYAIPRWRHHASLTWNQGPWSATLGQTFQSGYDEADQRLCDPEGQNCTRRRVGTYTVWDLQAQYTGFKRTTIVVGVKNLLDRDPPFAQWNPGLAAGYDPTYADPRGRVFYTRLNYAFK
jgi:iron complex outermembrane recepter protein